MGDQLPLPLEAKYMTPSGKKILENVQKEMVRCKGCKLAEKRRTVVVGEGATDRPPVAFVGEAPGATEDETGRPFVGPAGKLLNKMIGKMKLTRGQVFVCNVVCCRPPDNRKPERQEIGACFKFLAQQLRAVRPRVIVALGATAAKCLLRFTKPLGEYRNNWYEWEGIPLRVTYHPAFLIRPQGATSKREAWSDLQEVLKKVAELKEAEKNAALGKPKSQLEVSEDDIEDF